MIRTLRIALAQINLVVGDFKGNADKVIEWSNRAATLEADIVAFPELTITGYPPEDLVLKPDFIAANRRELDRVAASIGDMTAIVGFVDTDGDVYNAAAILQQGKVAGIYHKVFLPNYAVFDEQRHFRAGNRAVVCTVRDVKVGVTICEDIWYPVGPATVETASGAELIMNINASPYSFGRQQQRNRMIATRAQDEIAYVAYLNLVGGQDELVFEGSSHVFDWNGEIVAWGRAFDEDLLVADLDIGGVFGARLHDTRRRQMQVPSPLGNGGVDLITTPLSLPRPQSHSTPLKSEAAPPACSPEEEAYNALVLGTRDYVTKNRFERVFVALSGGIDSALTAVIAVDALGADRVTGVSMPSRFSSDHSRSDAAVLAKNLGICFLTIPIEEQFEATLKALGPVFDYRPVDITEENLQARIRGINMMALTNKFGGMVLTTGNKSETAVGYSTLYGDTAGGFAVLKDVYKTLVYRLARWRNEKAGGDLIPRNTLDKAPSAELREEQLDSDSLPPYEVLDAILEAYIEDDRSIDEIAAMGYDRTLVQRIVRLVDVNEYKRRQAPPGIRITTRAFGKDRRLPITNGYRPA